MTAETRTAHRNHRVKVSKALRAQVERTYGRICHLCGYRIDRQISVDHVKPVAHGGNTLLGNSRPSHQTCNEFRNCRPLTATLRGECRVRYERLIRGRKSCLLEPHDTPILHAPKRTA